MLFFSLFAVLSSISKELYHEEILKKYQVKILKECIIKSKCRIITGKRKFDHITPALRELRWLPVTSFLKYTLGVLAFKCVKGLAPSYLCHRFKTRDCVHDCKTRYKNNLNIQLISQLLGNAHCYTVQRVSGILCHVK